MSRYFILKNRTVHSCLDAMEWAKWFEENPSDRVVKQSEVNGAKISTVFLGIDHCYDGGEPILYETMIFGGPNDQYQYRYHTYKQAEEGHDKLVEKLTAGLVIDGTP